MSTEVNVPRSRRALLAAAAGGAAGLAASRLAGPEAVAAANPPLSAQPGQPRRPR